MLYNGILRCLFLLLLPKLCSSWTVIACSLESVVVEGGLVVEDLLVDGQTGYPLPAIIIGSPFRII